MAASWRDYLPSVLAERGGVAVSAISAESPPNRTNCTNRKLPADVASGLRLLANMKAPRGVDAAAWGLAAADAVALVDRGWAETAFGLGWSALDLFGAMPSTADDPHGDGLAACLAGRKVLMLDANCAAMSDDAGNRSYFHRPRAPGAVLLWALGRGR